MNEDRCHVRNQTWGGAGPWRAELDRAVPGATSSAAHWRVASTGPADASSRLRSAYPGSGIAANPCSPMAEATPLKGVRVSVQIRPGVPDLGRRPTFSRRLVKGERNECKAGELCRSLKEPPQGGPARRVSSARLGASASMTGPGSLPSSCTRASRPSSGYPGPAHLTSPNGSMSGPRNTALRILANYRGRPRWSFPATRAAGTGLPR
jgi:hypothetical protein